MATTKNGIYYPGDYYLVADVPEDMKKMAESIDEKVITDVINIKQEQQTQNTNITNLQTDTTTTKQDITNIKSEQTEQNKYIQELEAENERLKEDLNGLPTGQASGESIDLVDSAEMRLESYGVSGNSKQDSILPDEYTAVEYIESTGTQYIDTGVLATANTEYKVKFEYTQFSETVNGFIICGRVSSSSQNLSFTADEGKNFVGRGNRYIEITTPIEANKVYEYEVKKTQIKKNGIEISTEENIFEGTGTNSIHLLAGLQNGSITRMAKARMYYCKIYEGTTLIRNMIPCFRKADSVIGMYDAVNGVFYTNKGTGTFLKGNDKSILSPDYPSDIECCGDNINLLVTENSTNCTVSTDGSIIEENTRLCTDFIEINPEHSQFTVSANVTIGFLGLAFYDGDKQYISREYKNTVNVLQTTKPANAVYLKVFFQIKSGVNLNINSWFDYEVKLEKGTIVTQYTLPGQGCINEVICNKNLLNLKPDTYHYGGTMYTEGNTIIITGAPNLSASNRPNTSFKCNIKAGTTITYSARIIEGKEYYTTGWMMLNLRYVFKDGTILYNNAVAYNSSADRDKVKTQTITLEKDLVEISAYLGASAVLSSENSSKKIVIGLQLEKGSIATQYTPHKSQTFSIPTQQPFRSVGETRDTFIKKDGKWFERHIVYRKIFDGTETNWDNNPNNDGNVYVYLLSNFTNQAGLNMCNMFPSNLSGFVEKCDTRTINKLYMGIKKERLTSTNQAGIKKYLADLYNAGTPVYVDYILETPVDIECTEEQTRILDEIDKTVKSYKGVTHFYSTDNVSSIKTIVYRKDLDQLQTQLDEIKALLSTTQTSAMLVNNLENDLMEEV